MTVIDTSGLFAALDVDDKHHKAAHSAIKRASRPLLLSPFILAELDYMVATRLGQRAERMLLEDVAGGAYRLVEFTAKDVETAFTLLETYADLEIGLADASVTIIAARFRTTQLVTLDERHFRVIRPLWGEAFSLLPLDG